MNPQIKSMAVLSAILFVGGCAVGPNYKKPETRTPENFSEAPTTQPAGDLAQWWTKFNDPKLDSLIDRAVAQNLDLKIAAQRIREARALRGISGSQLWPQVDGVGGYSRSRRSNQTGQPNFGDRDTDLWSAGFDASWEIDVFGGLRREIESADAQIGAAIESQRDATVSLVSEVARNYLVLRGSQRQILITQNNIRTQAETLNLQKTRFKAGISSDLDVARSEAQVATTSATLPIFQTNVRQAIHALGVLLGQEPGSLQQELLVDSPIPSAGNVPYVPAGLPSELLLRRPDIRAAERQLAAATANIGVATSDYFPRFALTGQIGLQSDVLKNLPEGDSTFWGFGPSFRWNLLNFGRVRSNVEVQNARQQQALLSYDNTILSALREVEDSLVAYDRERERWAQLTQAVSSNRRAVDLANQLYSRGLVDFLSVLQAQRELFLVENQLVDSERQVSLNLIAIYKALGGGWSENGEK
jgi:NodT family efflux transporter outer membrane factor (OMF) lipoprotein